MPSLISALDTLLSCLYTSSTSKLTRRPYPTLELGISQPRTILFDCLTTTRRQLRDTIPVPCLLPGFSSPTIPQQGGKSVQP